MWESATVAEKKFNAETQRLIGEAQLHQYGLFLDEFNERLTRQKEKFVNTQQVSAQLISVDEHVDSNRSLSYLVHSDNKNLSKIMASLAGMCIEMNQLICEANELYRHFIVYENSAQKHLKHQSIAKVIRALQDVHCFVMRVQEVMLLTLNQLCAILGKNIYVSNNMSLFPEVLHSLGDLLICLVKLDNLLDMQVLKDHWFLYRKSVRNISYSSKFNIERHELSLFDKTLLRFENELLMGSILKNTISKCLDDKNMYFQIKNCSLNNEFYAFINTLLNDLEKDDDNIFDPKLWWKLNIFFVFYFNIFGNPDKKLIKRLLEINKKMCACTLIGNIMWYPEQFLLKHIHSFHKFIDEKAIESHRLALIQNRSASVQKETNFISLQACYFLIELKKVSEMNTNNLKIKQLQDIINLLTVGLKLVKKISLFINWILNLHADKDLPITKSVLTSVSKLTEILKCIHFMFQKNMITFTYIILLIIQHLQHRALAILVAIRKQFTQEKSYKQHQLDILSALNLCEQSLKKSSTSQTLLIANLTISASGLSSSNLSELRSVFKQLELFTRFSINITESSNCSFLLWHYDYMIPVYFSKLISSKSDISRYYLILKALTDYSFTSKETTTELTNKIITEHFYKPLEQIIENNLRLQTHLHLQLPHTDPFENYFSLNFYKCPPVAFDKYYKSIKNEVEHHLSTVFYNLTSVVLYDWRTYGEMRRLAYLQYGLSTVDDNLPMQTLGQGLDVLEIMRNINIFVSKYLYNLNSQMFIERESNNKHLNSINISHVANSIRTHGVGIMNTTVNFTYQFLRSKFYIFSQFIFDEHIKSRLIKDIRFFNEHKDKLSQMYPYEKAEKFNTGIKKLGLNEKEESYLDLFRSVITQIGNAMGYVRLIRSGGRRCLADGTSFIPNLEKINHLKDVVEQSEDISELTKKGGSSLIDSLQMYLDNLEEATEYFKLLVKVFVPVLRNKENIHLKNFYIIVPPLTINYIEYSLNCKEKLNKRNKAEYSFTDDGFVLGLAYIIEILNQEEHLNTLHWFDSVQRKLERDRQKIIEQIVADNSDNKLKQALSLSEKKVLAYEREFRLLFYNYNSARLFFQT